MRQNNNKYNKAFTITELIIIITSIAFITAAISFGSRIIRQTSLVKLASQIETMVSNDEIFKITYSFHAGDLPTAYDYFHDLGITGCDTELTDDVIIDSSTTDQGCNGNGDGNTSSPSGESKITMFHLRLANIVEENIGIDEYPKAAIQNYQEIIRLAYDSSGVFGTKGFAVIVEQDGDKGALSSVDTKIIDQKIDDGLCNSGELLAYSGDDIDGDSCSGGGYFDSDDCTLCCDTGAGSPAYSGDDKYPSCIIHRYYE